MTSAEREYIKQQYKKVQEIERIEADIEAFERTISVLRGSSQFIIDWEHTLSHLSTQDEYTHMLVRKILHDFGNKYIPLIKELLISNFQNEKQALIRKIEKL